MSPFIHFPLLLLEFCLSIFIFCAQIWWDIIIYFVPSLETNFPGAQFQSAGIGYLGTRRRCQVSKCLEEHSKKWTWKNVPKIWLEKVATYLCATTPTCMYANRSNWLIFKTDRREVFFRDSYRNFVRPFSSASSSSPLSSSS